MRSRRPPRFSPAPRSAFTGYRFPARSHHPGGPVVLAVWPVLPGREELLASEGIEVDHVTVYRWVHRFAPEFAEAARACRHIVGDRWHVDETYLKVGRTWRYLFRAIDQFGQVIDVFLSPRRDTSSARHFFERSAGPGSRPSRSPPTGTGSTPGCSMRCSRPPGTERRPTRTTCSKPTTDV